MDSFNIQNYFKRGKTVVLTLRQGDGDDQAGRQWSDKDTIMLMLLMTQFTNEFRHQKRRKKEVWIDISKRLNDDGYYWTPEDCRKKWSNMIRTFKTIEEQRREPSTSNKRIKWPFFEQMYTILTTDGADTLPEAVSVVHMLKDGSATEIVSSVTIENADSNAQNSEIGMNDVNLEIIMGAADEEVIVNQILTPNLSQQTSPSVSHVSHSPSNLVIESKHKTVPSSSVSQGNDNIMGGHKVVILPSTQSELGMKQVYSRGSQKAASKKKGNKSKKSGSSEQEDNTGDVIMDKFLAITTKQNEKILEQMSVFQESALSVMRERNDLLRNMCTLLRGQQQIQPRRPIRTLSNKKNIFAKLNKLKSQRLSPCTATISATSSISAHDAALEMVTNAKVTSVHASVPVPSLSLVHHLPANKPTEAISQPSNHSMNSTAIQSSSGVTRPTVMSLQPSLKPPTSMSALRSLKSPVKSTNSPQILITSNESKRSSSILTSTASSPPNSILSTRSGDAVISSVPTRVPPVPSMVLVHHLPVSKTTVDVIQQPCLVSTASAVPLLSGSSKPALRSVQTLGTSLKAPTHVAVYPAAKSSVHRSLNS